MDDQGTRIRLVNTIFAAQSMEKASQIAIFTLLSIMAVELSGRESLTGLPSTTMTLSRAFVALPIGLVMGRLGRRFGLTLSYSASAIGAFLGVLAILGGAFWLLLLSSALLGMGGAGGEQSRYAAGDMFPEGLRGRMIGRVVFAGTLGAIFGPLLVTPGTWLAEAFGLNPNAGPWVVALGMYSLAALVALVLLHPDPNTLAADLPKPEKAKRKPDDTNAPHPVTETDHGRSVRQLFEIPAVRLAVISMLISQVVMVALMVITPLHMVHHAHGNQEVSWVISVHTLGMFAFSSLTGWLIDRFGAIHVMLLGGLVLLISAVIAPLSPALPVVLLGLFLLGIGWNFGFIAGSALLSDSLHGLERARMQGIADMLIAGAAAIGSLSSGPVYSWGGYTGVAVLGGVLTLIFLYVIRLMGAQARRLQTAV